MEVLRDLRRDRFTRREQLQTRATQLLVWAVTGLFATSGYFLAFQDAFTVPLKVLYTVFVGVAAAVLYWYLSELASEYRMQLKILSRIEKRLGLFDSSESQPVPLLPPEWLEARTDSTHFVFPGVALAVAVGATLLVLWGRGWIF